METPHAALLRSRLSDDLEANVQRFQRILNADVNSDAHFRYFTTGEKRVCLIYIEGMASDAKVADFALRAMADHPGARDLEALRERVLELAQCDMAESVGDIARAVVTGMTALLMAGEARALLMETRGYPARQVDKPTNESVVLGSQEGFVESLRTNLTLLRRYVPSPRLVTESLTVGRDVPCQASLVWLEGVTPEGVVEALRARLMAVDAPAVRGIGELQQYIEDRPWALLPQFLQTERPDRAASCLLEGQAVVLADNSPYALAAPVSAFHLLHASDDGFARWQYGTFLRFIRFAGTLVSVLLPGLYIALIEHHAHLIPMSLLASIISPILIIIVALTGLGNYAVPDYGFGLGLILYRLGALLAGALFGLYGICAASFCAVTGLCALRSLGQPYLAPVAPPRPHGMDILLRGPVWRQGKGGRS